LRIQYSDYAQWQREWLKGAVLEAELGYWREQLGGAPSQLELTGAKPRPKVQSYRGAQQEFELDGELTQALRKVSGREGVTLFMTLLAGFGVVLQYYSGSEEVVVGTDVAGRNQRETEELIGFFVNQLALRVDLRGNPRFGELLGRVRGVCLGAYGHQEVPFEKVVEAVRPERGASHAPLFQVKLVLQNTPSTELTLPGLTLSPWPYKASTTKLDLIMFVNETASGLNCILEYNLDLFEPTMIAQIARNYALLMSSIVANSKEKLSGLRSILAEANSEDVMAQAKRLEAQHLDLFKSVKPQPIAIKQAISEWI
jgi:non-ribosomal peptide synthetase component F